MPVLLFSRQLKGFWVGQIISTFSTSFTVSVFSFEPPRQSILCHNKARQPYRFPSSPTKYEWLPSQFVSSGKTHQQWYAGCASTMHPLPECSLAVERCMPYIVGGRECNCLPEKFNMFYTYSSIPISSFDPHIPWCFRETVNPVTHDFSVHQSPNIFHISRGLTNLQFDMGSLVTMVFICRHCWPPHQRSSWIGSHSPEDLFSAMGISCTASPPPHWSSAPFTPLQLVWL